MRPYYTTIVALCFLCALLTYGFMRGSLRTNGIVAVQPQSEDPRTCKTVHLVMIISGTKAVGQFSTVMKSILWNTVSPLHLHILTDNSSRNSLEHLVQPWEMLHLHVSYYDSEALLPKVAIVKTNHYSGLYSCLKLLLDEIILSTSQLIVLDTDLVFASDVGALWNHFESFDDHQLLGIAETQSAWYLTPANWPWPALGRGYNAGVMLMHLGRMRASGWASVWRTVYEQVMSQRPADRKYASLSDQDILNAVLVHDSALLYELPCTWNIQLSTHSEAERCIVATGKWDVVHWNSPLKQDVALPYAKYFKDVHAFYAKLDMSDVKRPPPCKSP